MFISVFTDGACRVSNPGLCSSAFVVYKGSELLHKEGRVLEGLKTNNEAEYTALLDFLKWADKHNVRNAFIHCDSALVVNQTLQQWECNKPDLRKLSTQAYGLLVRGAHMLKHVRGHGKNEDEVINARNGEADALCNALLDKHQEEYLVSKN
jgi:ribonuclease HI